MTEPITEQQLDEIQAKAAELRERLDRKNPWPSDNESHWIADGWKSGTRNALDKLHAEALIAEVRRQRTELAAVEMCAPQQCPAGKHADWLVDSEYAHACPWCQIESLRTSLTTSNNMLNGTAQLAGRLDTRLRTLATAASTPPVAPLAASQPSGVSESAQSPTGAPTGPHRTLTPNEYSAAWRAVEGSAGDEGADPGTVLHAVLDRLGIQWQDAAQPTATTTTAR